MSEYPLVSVIILNYNGKKVLIPCLKSIFASDYPNFEVVLVDNCSEDDSIEEAEIMFKNQKNLRIIRNRVPMFYAAGNNIGAIYAKGEFVVFINNDTEVESNWLKELILVFEDSSIGAVQPKILYYDEPEIIDNVGGEMDLFGFGFGKGHGQIDRGQFDETSEVFFASGVAFSTRKDLINKLGLFDDRYIFYCEDIDFSWKLRLNGYRVIMCPRSKVYHKVSKTTRLFSTYKELTFHSRKNRISNLLKNYSFFSLFIFLPVTLFIYLIIYLKEAVLDRNIGLANTIFSAIKWNVKNLSYTVSKRKIVQCRIRRVSDFVILRHLYKFPLIIKYGI